MNEVTRAKWSAGIAMIFVIAILVLGSKAANAEVRVTSTGINKHVVVTTINYGYTSSLYRTDKDGKLILMDTVIMYKGLSMTPKQYDRYRDLETLAKAGVPYAKAQKIADAAMTARDALEQGQCNNPLTIPIQ